MYHTDQLNPDLKTGVLTGIWSSAEWSRDQLPVSMLPEWSLCTTDQLKPDLKTGVLTGIWSSAEWRKR
jgi:hypothetical protein